MSVGETRRASAAAPSPAAKPPAGFRIGTVLRRSYAVFSRNFLNLIGICAIAVLPSLFVPAPADGYAPVNLGLPGWAAAFIYLTSFLVGQCVACFTAFQRMQGRTISASASAELGLPRFLPLVELVLPILGIIGFLQSLLSYRAAVLAGIILLPFWSVVMPVCVIEGLGPLRSLGRSRELTKGHRWRMLMLVLLATAGGVALLTATRFLARSVLSLGPFAIIGPLARINQIAWTAVWTAFLAALLAVSYDELRTARGGHEPDQLVAVFE